MMEKINRRSFCGLMEKINRRSFWGLFVGLLTATPVMRNLPTYNKNEWTRHKRTKHDQDMFIRSWKAEAYYCSYIYKPPYYNTEFPADNRTVEACKARGMFGSNKLKRYFGPWK